MKQKKCPVCGTDKIKKFTKFDSAGEHRIFSRCEFCSHIFASDFSCAVLEETYKQGYYPSPDSEKIQEWINTNKHVWLDLCSDIKNFKADIRSILDFGAGTGGFLETFRDTNPQLDDIHAVENAENAKINLQRRFPNSKIYSEIDECAKNDFDCIVSLQCFEHIDEPLKICKTIHDRIANGGILVVTVPNRYSLRTLFLKYRDVYNIGNPTHLQFFSAKTLRRMLAESGFKDIQRIASFPKTGNLFRRIITFSMRKFALSSELRFICKK